MKKYTQKDREAAIKEIDEAPIEAKEWEVHETKITSYRYVDDMPGGKKKGLLSGLLERVKAVFHPA